jgi:hypothetical protein
MSPSTAQTIQTERRRLRWLNARRALGLFLMTAMLLCANAAWNTGRPGLVFLHGAILGVLLWSDRLFRQRIAEIREHLHYIEIDVTHDPRHPKPQD